MTIRTRSKKVATNQKTISSETSEGRAKLALMPEVNSAIVIDAMCKSLGEQSITELMRPLRENTKAVQGGNLGEAEAMLMSQATTLQTIFTELSRRAALNMGEYINAMETYMRLALKAQSQCARTLEVLAAIKNPPVVIAKQANIANGPQQVNNGIPSHTGKTETEPTKLISGDNHATLDTSGTATTSRVNQDLEALGAINRPENNRG